MYDIIKAHWCICTSIVLNGRINHFVKWRLWIIMVMICVAYCAITVPCSAHLSLSCGLEDFGLALILGPQVAPSERAAGFGDDTRAEASYVRAWWSRSALKCMRNKCSTARYAPWWQNPDKCLIWTWMMINESAWLVVLFCEERFR